MASSPYSDVPASSSSSSSSSSSGRDALPVRALTLRHVRADLESFLEPCSQPRYVPPSVASCSGRDSDSDRNSPHAHVVAVAVAVKAHVEARAITESTDKEDENAETLLAAWEGRKLPQSQNTSPTNDAKGRQPRRENSTTTIEATRQSLAGATYTTTFGGSSKSMSQPNAAADAQKDSQATSVAETTPTHENKQIDEVATTDNKRKSFRSVVKSVIFGKAFLKKKVAPVEHEQQQSEAEPATTLSREKSGDIAWAVAMIAQRWRKKANAHLIPFLSPFVPRVLQEEVGGEGTGFLDPTHTFARRQQTLAGPCASSREVAILLADISGFTPLTEKLSKRGSRGVEMLTKCINAYFSAAIEIVHRHGGDVIKFAGDAMIIMFQDVVNPNEELDDTEKDITEKSVDEIAAEIDQGASNTNKSLARATVRAGWCAASLASKLGHVEMQKDGSVKPLSVKNLSRKNIGAEALKMFASNMDETRASADGKRSSKVGSLLAKQASSKLLKSAVSRRSMKAASQGPEPSSPISSGPVVESVSTPNGKANEEWELTTPVSPGTPEADDEDTGFTKRLSRRRSSLAELSGMLPNAGESGALKDDEKMHGGSRMKYLTPPSTSDAEVSMCTSIGMLRAGLACLSMCACAGYQGGQVYPGSPKRKSPHSFSSFSKSFNQSAHRSFAKSFSGRNDLPNVSRTSSRMNETRLEDNESIHGGLIDEEDKPKLSLKLIVAAGKVHLMNVGGGESSTASKNMGDARRFEFLIADPAHNVHGRAPFQQIKDAEDEAEPGDIILTQEAVEYVGDEFQLELRPTGNARIVGLAMAARWRQKSKGGNDEYQGALDALEASMTAPRPPEIYRMSARRQAMSLKRIRRYVVGQVRNRVEAGHNDFVNEIRVLSVVFFGFPALQKPLPEGQKQPDVEEALEKLQACTIDLQTALRRHSGTLLQIRCDEKGYLAVCAFGLPGQAFEDNPERAIACASTVLTSKGGKRAGAVAGVTTGQLFCAVVGAPERVEYTVFGDAINLSARLMVKAKNGLGNTGLLCDGLTHGACMDGGDTIDGKFTKLQPLPVKGKAEPVQVFAVDPTRSQEEVDDARTREQKVQAKIDSLIAFGGPKIMNSGDSVTDDSIPMVGRDDDLAIVQSCIWGFTDDSAKRLEALSPKARLPSARCKFVLVQGAQGLGKSRFLGSVREMAKEKSLHTIYVKTTGSRDNRNIPYMAWVLCLIQLERIVKNVLDHGDESSAVKNEGLTEVHLATISRLKMEIQAISNASFRGPGHDSAVVDTFESARLLREQMRSLAASSEKTLTAPEKAVQRKSNPGVIVEGHSQKHLTKYRNLNDDTKVSHDDSEIRTFLDGSHMHTSDISIVTTGMHTERKFLNFLSGLMNVLPMVFLFDDLDELDSYSLDFFLTLLECEPSTVLIATYDPEIVATNAAERKYKQQIYQSLQKVASHEIKLNTLDREGTARLIRHVTHLTDVPVEYIDSVYERSAGHPNMVKHIVTFLNNQTAALSEQSDEVGEGQLRMFLAKETGLESKFTRMLDALSAKLQLMLKVASVIGDRITSTLLTKVHPLHPPILGVQRDVGELVAQGFLKPMVGDNRDALELCFSGQLLRDSVYDIVPTIQRSKLHEAVAKCDLVPLSIAVEHAEMAKNPALCSSLYKQLAHEKKKDGNLIGFARAMTQASNFATRDLKVALEAAEAWADIKEREEFVDKIKHCALLLRDDHEMLKSSQGGLLNRLCGTKVDDDDVMELSKDEMSRQIRPARDAESIHKLISLCNASFSHMTYSDEQREDITAILVYALPARTRAKAYMKKVQRRFDKYMSMKTRSGSQ
ncbi:adenylate [Pycnococcus provasolii]